MFIHVLIIWFAIDLHDISLLLRYIPVYNNIYYTLLTILG